MNIHYLILGIALGLAVLAAFRPQWLLLNMSVILIAIELFSKVTK